MDFGQQIKTIRTTHQLTQEQFGQQLNVTRQAISNWENNKNLPDLEMIITIADTFNLTVDDLLLRENNQTNLTKKLISESKETTRLKINLTTIIIGSFLLILGSACLFIKANSVEYVDSSGILHENFFLLPIGFLFILSGGLVISISSFIYLRSQWLRQH